MVGGGDRDRVELLVVQGLADVLHARRRVAALIPDLLPARLEQAAVGVDQVGDLHALKAEVLIDVGAALPVDPGHADADANGMVALPDINIYEEMVDLMSSSRAYEANLDVVKTARSMALQTLSIGKH